ncbi:MAG: hypothetical protein KJ950_14315 [Proteobacteria bacterium]|nr:hypothetical protein [Pseudomonadota bacterium]MBU1687903.1 hypothetical protein [Pseudomonadota bacterium]
MKKVLTLILCWLVLVTVTVPRAMADIDTEFETIEKSLVTELPPEAVVPESAKEEGGSSWWKWGLGLLAIGAIGAAAGGGGGGGGGGTPSGGTGTVSASW